MTTRRLITSRKDAVAPLAQAAVGTLAQQLAQQFTDHISQGRLAAGARLPSVRECARLQGVSPHTVVAAYDQLQALGLVEARAQRGYFVRQGRKAVAARTPVPAPERPPPMNAMALVRGMFQGGSRHPAPGLGTLPAEWLDLPLLHGAMRRVMSSISACQPSNLQGPDDASAAPLGQTQRRPLAPAFAEREHDDTLALQYGHPQGDARLRQALVHKVVDHGLRCTSEQIITASGATQALDIICRTLLSPGDAVLVDDPAWAVEYARLAHLGMRLLPVPRLADGPDLAVMQALAREHRPRMYTTVPVLHNPTGSSFGLAAAHQVLKLAEAHDFWVVEDDTYAHLAPAHLPRMSALDGLQRTLYVSGFSEILSPAWRVGYLIAPPGLVERLVDTKLLSTLGTPATLERAVAMCLEQGSLRRHAERVISRLERARHRAVQWAQQTGCRFVTPPDGLFGWVDVGVNSEALAMAMHTDGWLLAPGHLFMAQPRPNTLMRINFAVSQDLRFWRSLERVRERIRPPA